MSADAEARAAHLPPGEVVKTVVLHDGDAYVIAAIPASERPDLHEVRNLLGASCQLQPVAEDQIAREIMSLTLLLVINDLN